MDGDVGVLVEEIAQRVPHLGGLQQVGRELVEQRLERVVVVLVDEDDIGVGVLQRPGRADAGEASAEDDDTRPPRLGAVGLDRACHGYLPWRRGRRGSRTRLHWADPIAHHPLGMKPRLWWIGVLFMVGSTAFALGSAPFYAELVEPAVVGVTFFVGSIFFTTASLLQLKQTPRLDRLDWWACVVQFAGHALLQRHDLHRDERRALDGAGGHPRLGA